jgi:hypothetical protein
MITLPFYSDDSFSSKGQRRKENAPPLHLCRKFLC